MRAERHNAHRDIATLNYAIVSTFVTMVGVAAPAASWRRRPNKYPSFFEKSHALLILPPLFQFSHDTFGMNGLLNSHSVIYTMLAVFLAGLIGRAFMPGDNKMGCLLTMGLGIGGACVSSFLGHFLGFYTPGTTAGFWGAVIGAIVILCLWRLLCAH